MLRSRVFYLYVIMASFLLTSVGRDKKHKMTQSTMKDFDGARDDGFGAGFPITHTS